MTGKQAGLSAMAMAYARAYHATHDTPRIFDDFLADSLFTPEAHAQMDQIWAGLLQYVDPELAATNPDPANALAADLDRLGLRLEENLDPAAIEARYYQGRSDRYHAVEHVHFARVVVA